jgi:hypothetical protein
MPGSPASSSNRPRPEHASARLPRSVSISRSRPTKVPPAARRGTTASLRGSGAVPERSGKREIFATITPRTRRLQHPHTRQQGTRENHTRRPTYMQGFREGLQISETPWRLSVVFVQEQTPIPAQPRATYRSLTQWSLYNKHLLILPDQRCCCRGGFDNCQRFPGRRDHCIEVAESLVNKCLGEPTLDLR